VESVVSASLIVLVVRTRHSLLRSRPSRLLLIATIGVVIATVMLPATGLGALFGFVPLPPIFLPILGVIVLGYVATAELVKHWFYRQLNGTSRVHHAWLFGPAPTP
jgi:Mg2+-importing ATPase